MINWQNNGLWSPAARGLRQPITRALEREGAGVVVNDHRSQPTAKPLVHEPSPRAIAASAEVIDTTAVQRLCAQRRRNAPASPPAPC